MSERGFSEAKRGTPAAGGSAGGLLQRTCACGTKSAGGGCAGCAEEKSALRRRAGTGREPSGVPAIVHDVLRSAGQTLDGGARAFFEPRFGRDFSRVRVHTDARAAESARSVNALAYTVGNHIVFAKPPAVGSVADRHLLAHELAHTVQQRGAGLAAAAASRISRPDDAGEREAEAIAARVVRGDDPGAVASVSAAAPSVQRLGDPMKIPPRVRAACEIATDDPMENGERVLFPNRVATLTPLQRAGLDHFAANWRAEGASARVRVDGFASAPGTDELNWTLACDRAHAVAAALEHPTSGGPGIPSSFVRVIAHGETSEFGAEAENRCALVTSAAPRRAAPPEAQRCVPGPGIPNTRCSAYAANGWWLPSAYVDNATCACVTTPNLPEYNCIRNELQMRLAATPPLVKSMAAGMKRFETSADPIDKLVYKQWVVDHLTPRIYADHVAAYRSCCCPGAPAGYGAWIGVTTVPPISCNVVGALILLFGPCSARPGRW